MIDGGEHNTTEDCPLKLRLLFPVILPIETVLKSFIRLIIVWVGDIGRQNAHFYHICCKVVQYSYEGRNAG